MILVINPGSSSLKIKIFDNNFNVVKSIDFDYLTEYGRKRESAAGEIVREVAEEQKKIEKIGYRVVHGGDEAEEIMPITLPVMNIIKKFSPLAPFHNPEVEKIIRVLIEKIPFAQHFAVFDTAFFRNLPNVSKIYPLNQQIADELGIKRYGFHGISHQWTVNQVDSDHSKKMITIHLGAGSSLAAINRGKPIDTSMGFTPVGGVAMQNRSGDLDPEIIFALINHLGQKKAKEMIEFHSGMAGMTNSSGNMLTLLAVAGEKVEDKEYHLGMDKMAKNFTKEEAALAIELFCYRVKKCLGAYIAALGGVDIVAFSGEIGFGSSVIRNKILSGLKFLNFQVEVVKPDEELAIAKKLK